MRATAVAMVGLGDIALSGHLPALQRCTRLTVAALVDPQPGRREAAAAVIAGAGAGAGQGGVPCQAEELDDVLADPEVRGVILATPPWVTPGLAVQALRAGRYVLAEKPVATSMAATAAYDVLTPGERSRLQVGLAYRNDPVLEQLHELLRSDDLGTPLLVRAHVYDERRDAKDAEHSTRIETTLAHGSPVVHEGAHVFDWLTYLLGGPGRVQDAWAVATRPDLPNPNLTGARLAYPGGTVALVEFGWLTEALPRCELSLLGDRGHALLDGHSFRLKVTTSGGTVVTDPPKDRMSRCFDRQLDRFADLLDGIRAAGSPSLEDGVEALATAEQVVAVAQSQTVLLGRPS